MERLWRIAVALERRRRGRKPALLFFTDPARTPDPGAVVARMPRGSAVVFRAFGAADAEARGRALARIARRRGVLFIVGADVALARRLGADGVHLPERLAHRAATARGFAIVTAAAHSERAVRAARRAGADAVVLSPVFASRSPSAGRPLGVVRFARLARLAPAYALGGVDARTAGRLRGSAAIGLAAVEGLQGRLAARPRT